MSIWHKVTEPDDIEIDGEDINILYKTDNQGNSYVYFKKSIITKLLGINKDGCPCDGIKNIISAREQLKQAESLTCECSGPSLQYNQGCKCDKGKARDKAKRDLEKAIEEL